MGPVPQATFESLYALMPTKTSDIYRRVELGMVSINDLQREELKRARYTCANPQNELGCISSSFTQPHSERSANDVRGMGHIMVRQPFPTSPLQCCCGRCSGLRCFGAGFSKTEPCRHAPWTPSWHDVAGALIIYD